MKYWIGVLLWVVACGKREEEPMVEAPTPQGEVCESTNDQSIHGELDSRLIKLIREDRYERHYDCNGHLTREGEAMSESPATWLTKKVPGLTEDTTCSFRNRRVCDDTMMKVYSPGTEEVTIRVDYNHGWANLHVETGENYVDWSCKTCLRWEQNADGNSCTEWGPEMVGTLLLHVEYEARRAPDAEFRPNEASCR